MEKKSMITNINLSKNDAVFSIQIVDGDFQHWQNKYQLFNVSPSRRGKIKIVRSDNVFVLVFKAPTVLAMPIDEFAEILLTSIYSYANAAPDDGMSYIESEVLTFDDSGKQIPNSEKMEKILEDALIIIGENEPLLKNAIRTKINFNPNEEEYK